MLYLANDKILYDPSLKKIIRNPIHYRRNNIPIHRPAIDFRRRFNGRYILFPLHFFLKALQTILAAAEGVATVTTMDITGTVPVIRICKNGLAENILSAAGKSSGIEN